MVYIFIGQQPIQQTADLKITESRLYTAQYFLLRKLL